MKKALNETWRNINATGFRVQRDDGRGGVTGRRKSVNVFKMA